MILLNIARCAQCQEGIVGARTDCPVLNCRLLANFRHGPDQFGEEERRENRDMGFAGAAIGRKGRARIPDR